MTVRVEGLAFAYHGRPVLRGVDLTWGDGQLVCLLGANGAGKTTLFRCVLGLQTGYRGRVWLDDTDLAQRSPRDIARSIAYLPQTERSAFNYTVAQVALMGTYPLTSALIGPRPAQLARVRAALDQLGLTHLAERGFQELSGGERQSVLVARALAQSSGGLLLDEPTASLDFGNGWRLMTTARRLADEGRLVVVSTHDPTLALRFADHVTVLDEGQVLADGPADQVVTSALIEQVYKLTAEVTTVKVETGLVPVVVPVE
ncbi:MAG: ABC transporter ATP-binding protein [Propionibacteriaceae bacterium]|jgi:iron complex transport system ATP-binding protein|nr:ABC transporter ATP-binding protein [Propionibacteriaceae bacterium]